MGPPQLLNPITYACDSKDPSGHVVTTKESVKTKLTARGLQRRKIKATLVLEDVIEPQNNHAETAPLQGSLSEKTRKQYSYCLQRGAGGSLDSQLSS